MRGLSVISKMMHPSFDFNPRMLPGKSKNSCVLCSLTVRDFLKCIGCENVNVRPVLTILAAECEGKVLHSLGIGSGEASATEGYWDGHLIATADGFLIDTTLYHARRIAWPDMPGMAVVPIQRGRRPSAYGLKPIAGISLAEPEHNYEFTMLWLDNPKNAGWEIGPDATRNHNLRAPVITAMLRKYAEELKA
jgi:hypothetical protein